MLRHAVRTMPPGSSPAESASERRDFRRPELLASQIRLLYGNANVGVGVTLVAAPILGRLQWGVISHRLVLGWCAYMVLVVGGEVRPVAALSAPRPRETRVRAGGAARSPWAQL